jgi:hypothetical protein
VPEEPLAPEQSIEEMAAQNGDHPEDLQEPIFALEGDKQLTLAGLGPRTMAIESEVSLMSASVPCRGLIDPNKEGRLIVSYVPVREGGKIVKWKLRQYLRIMYVDTVLEGEEAPSPDDQ